jgi:cyclopropane fatty-acyl-phospholipid synthase-like methyltransferase
MNNEMYTEGEYLKRNPMWHTEDSPWKAEQILKVIQRNNLHPKSICEIGCGAGEILHQLYRQMPAAATFAGYEISPQAFERCQLRAKSRLRFYLTDWTQDPNVFDVVLIVDVLEHVEDYLGFLKEVRKKGGYKIFHIPLDLSAQTVLRSSPILRKRQEVGHLHYFTEATALATLKDTGYVIKDSFYAADSVKFRPKSFKSLVARLARKVLYGLNNNFTVRLLGGYSLWVLAV